MAHTAFDTLWEAKQARLQTVVLESGPVQVHRAGEGKPILFIHGWAMGGRAFAHQLDLIEMGFEVIAPDLPGFAGTAPAPESPTIETMAQILGELIERLDLSGVILVGWSMGATIAWQLAAKNSKRLSAVVSIDMSPMVGSSGDWALGLIGGVSEQRTLDAMVSMQSDWKSYCELFLNRILLVPNTELRAGLSALANQADPRTAAATWLSLTQFDARQKLSTIDLPALTVHGGSSALYRQEVGSEIARLMPDCEDVVLSGVGHAPHVEAADAFNSLLVGLSDKVHTTSKKQLTLQYP
jgi:pimeloyl-ACP methyl ester carboxylesterase